MSLLLCTAYTSTTLHTQHSQSLTVYMGIAVGLTQLQHKRTSLWTHPDFAVGLHGTSDSVAIKYVNARTSVPKGQCAYPWYVLPCLTLPLRSHIRASHRNDRQSAGAFGIGQSNPDVSVVNLLMNLKLPHGMHEAGACTWPMHFHWRLEQACSKDAVIVPMISDACVSYTERTRPWS